MSRKKRFYIIFPLVLLAALTLFLATACEEHEHNYVARNNTAAHWLQCTGCDSVTEYYNHDYDDLYVCKDCGFNFLLDYELNSDNASYSVRMNDRNRGYEIEYVRIPESYDGLHVTGICANGFRGYDCLKEVYIPQSVVKIGGSAFEDCKNFTKLNSAAGILSGVTVVEDYAFKGSGLTGITLSDSAVKIGRYAFADCAALTSCVIPNSVTEIGEYAFYNCASLQSINLPSGLKALNKYTFAYCSALEAITLPNGLESIQTRCFAYCYSLKEIVIPDSVTWMNIYVFDYCTSLERATLSAGLDNVVTDTFNGCSSLVSVVIPEGIKGVESGAFADCTSLTGLTLPSTIVSISAEAFARCSSLKKMVIPANVTFVGGSAFLNCTELTELVFEVKEGWYYEYTESDSKVYLSVDEVSDAAAMATALRGESGYGHDLIRD